MRPPRYARDVVDLKELLKGAKLWACRYCPALGTLNLHGPLRGAAEDGRGKDAIRGWRLVCSARGKRGGCGRTFSILLSSVIFGASVRAGQLWRFYRAKLAGASVLAAWEGCRSRFSVEAAYGWWRRWRRRSEFALREALCRGRDPPEDGLGAALSAVYGAEDPIGAFQLGEQRGWP